MCRKKKNKSVISIICNRELLHINISSTFKVIPIGSSVSFWNCTRRTRLTESIIKSSSSSCKGKKNDCVCSFGNAPNDGAVIVWGVFDRNTPPLRYENGNCDDVDACKIYL